MKIDSIIKTLLKSFFGLVLLANIAYGGATLTVNSGSMLNLCNSELSLTEAAALARGTLSRSLSTGEISQISGATFVPSIPAPSCGVEGWTAVNGVGANFADDILFTNNVGTLSGVVFLGKNDDINGLKPNGQKVILDGTGLSAPNYGISIDNESGSQVRNLIIRNFPTAGIFAQALNGAKFEGLEIFGNGAYGLSLGFAGSPINKNSRNVTIGGDQPQQRNKIFANASHGIFIVASPDFDRSPNQGIVILNNFIGTIDGTTDNGNAGNGILLQDTFGVQIGDLTAATRNVVSGNNQDGVKIIGANAVSNTIVNNFIGTNISGDAPLGNSLSGVALTDGCGLGVDFITNSPNRVGIPGAGNVISGNSWGIFIGFGNASKNVVQANYIGSNLGGNTDIGNLNEGVYLGNTSFDNIIGGAGTGEANLIAFNNRNGIYQDDGARNVYRRNRVFANDLMGIDIAPRAGVNPNDDLDTDSGPNGLLNYPLINYVLASSSTVNINGTFNSAANQTFTLEFFGNSSVDATGYGEGRNFLGTAPVTTNASGNASFDVTFSTTLSAVGSWVTATATDASNNTSEYSQARNICADLRLSPGSILAPLGGISTSFTYLTSPGCAVPTAVSNSAWITVGNVGSGSVFFTVAANSGPPRDGLINVNYNNGAGQTTTSFLVSQNNGCTYSINPTSQSFSSNGGNGTVTVTPSNALCMWTATSNVSWITVAGGGSGTGSGTVGYSVMQNPGNARSGTMTIAGQTFAVNQGANCDVLFSPRIVNVGAQGGSVNVNITIGAGCNWTATTTDSWITITSGGSGTGNGTVGFTVSGNTGTARTGFINLPQGQFVTVNQAAAGCFTSFTPTSANVGGAGGTGSFGVTTNCGWAASSNASWITITGGGTGTTGSGTISYSAQPNTGPARSGTITTLGATFTVNQAAKPARFDFDGDRKTDVSVFRPSNGSWWYVRSLDNQNRVYSFGVSTDKPVPADYTGDGRADIAVWRPSNGTWYVQRSEDGSFFSIPFGAAGDIPCPGDFDRDGKADIAVFRPSTGTWYISYAVGGTAIISFGVSGDVPVVEDYDGDGKADIAVFRPSGGSWWILRSSTGVTFSTTFGNSLDKPVPADYTGDGKADIAVWRPADGLWYVLRSEDFSYFSVPFGSTGDIPVAGDYDGDGRADFAVFRPSNVTWYLNRTTAGIAIYTFGAPGDHPVPAAFVP